MNRRIIAISVSAVIVAIIAASFVYYFFFKPNDKVVPAFDESGINFIIEGGYIQDAKYLPKIVDDEVLLPLETIKKYFDPNINWDENLKKVTVTTKDRVIRMKTDSLEAMINNKPVELKIPVTMDNGNIFVPVEFLSDFYNIEVAYLKAENVVIIDYGNKIKRYAEPIGADAVIRKGRSIRMPILKKFDSNSDKPADTALRIFEEYDKWYKVRTAEGIIGYMEKRNVVIKDLVVKKIPREESKNTAWKPEKGKINLVWEMMYSKRPDLAKINKMDGLDVVSPTWFQVANDNGTLINRADAKYVEWAHQNGYKVWALLANDFGSASSTKKLLNNADARDNVIRQVLSFAALYKLDGINIDFENINKEDRDALTQFVREITPFLREQGLVVSIDVTVPDGSDNWSLCYDRKALGQIVDYVMVMTYDQHWSTSPKAGSVAQVTWVESNLKKVLEMVPREKLLLGLPFYTRLWEEKPDKDGKIKVSSKAITMEAAKKLAKENNSETKWDEASGQFYSEYKKDGSVFKVWMEDENSIDLKSSLVQKYKLAGAASWSRTYEVPAVWNVLNRNLKDIGSYQDWVAVNKEKKYVFN